MSTIIYNRSTKTFARVDYEGLSPKQEATMKQIRHNIAKQLNEERLKHNDEWLQENGKAVQGFINGKDKYHNRSGVIESKISGERFHVNNLAPYFGDKQKNLAHQAMVLRNHKHIKDLNYAEDAKRKLYESVTGKKSPLKHRRQYQNDANNPFTTLYNPTGKINKEPIKTFKLINVDPKYKG